LTRTPGRQKQNLCNQRNPRLKRQKNIIFHQFFEHFAKIRRKSIENTKKYKNFLKNFA